MQVLRRQVRWSGIPIPLRIFQFVVIHTVKGFSIVNEAEVFSEIPLLFFMIQRMLAIWSLGPLPFLKSSLYIWKFSVHILLKPVFPGGSYGKESACNAGGPGSNTGSGCPGKGNGNPLQYSCPGNPKDRVAWWTTVHVAAESRKRLNNT